MLSFAKSEFTENVLRRSCGDSRKLPLKKAVTHSYTAVRQNWLEMAFPDRFKRYVRMSGAGCYLVSLDVGRMGELLREEHVLLLRGEGLGFLERTEEAAFLARHRQHFSAERTNQVHALSTHPARDVDAYVVSQRAADFGKGDAGVSAGGLDDGVPRDGAGRIHSRSGSCAASSDP